MTFDKEFLHSLFEKAAESSRQRESYDLRTSALDGSQRMLNALLPSTVVPVHRHKKTSESVVCLFG